MPPRHAKPKNFNLTPLAALAAYTGLALLLTWPVAGRLAGVVGGFDGRDSFQHVWLNWWFWEALLNRQQLPAHVTAIYFPYGANHPVLWLHPLVNLLSLPLTGTIGPTAAYNLLLILSISLTGLTAYLLAFDLTRQPHAAFLGGLIFALAPNRLGHLAAGHQLLAFGLALSLYALALRLWLRRPTRRVTALLVLSLLLVLLTHPNFIGYFLLPVTAVLIPGHWWSKGWFTRRQWQQLLAAGLLAGLLFLPFAWPFAADLATHGLTYLDPQDPGEHSADLLSFITPSPFHPLWRESPPAWLTAVLDRPRALEEGFNYLGLAALALAGLAVWRRWRQVREWALLALLSGLLSLGPTLKFNGIDTGLPLPYALLVNLPFFSWSRTPGRLNMTTMLAFSVIAAAGAGWLLARYRPARWPLTLALTAFIAAEVLPLWPFPVDARPVSPYTATLAQTNRSTGLLSLPVTGSRRASNYAMADQTIHRHPLAGGYIERDPPGTVELKEFLNGLVTPLPEQTVFAAPTAAERRAVLVDLGLGPVVTQTPLMTDRTARAQLDYLPRLLGAPQYTDEQVQAYTLPAAGADLLPQLFLLPDTENWEVLADGNALRLKKSGFFFIYQAEPGCATLALRPVNPSTAVALNWQLNNSLVKTGMIQTGSPQFLADLPLRRGLNTIRLTTSPEQELDLARIEISAVAPACAEKTQ
ncbi:MAG: hypothetical protein FOGNACKC_00428 [Anaerolineae bacterium]|nr:hypothetical protein [Anaerolineae bacterium]